MEVKEIILSEEVAYFFDNKKFMEAYLASLI